VTFPPGSPSWFEHGRRAVSVLPTQLFEALALVCLFTLLLYVRRRFSSSQKYRSGLITGVYFIGYAIIRFGIEYLRGDPRAAIGPLSISQAISVYMAFMGAAFIAYSRFSARTEEGAN
jgi:phosphatidylglycerol:prolipoprotein diacylglycerol transferase